MLRIAAIAVAVASLAFPAPSLADNWMQWRGPKLDGASAETGLPAKLDPAAGGNVVWKTPMPGNGAGTPIVFEDKVFVSSLDNQSKKLLAICLDNKTGKVLWQRECGDGFITTNRINLAGPSAITDGKTVWFYFGSGDLAAFDLDGKPIWARNLEKDFGKFNFQWIYCSSPLLHEGKLYVQVLHRNEPVNGRGSGSPNSPAQSYLLALNPATGKDIFRHIRPNSALAESQESYTTPMPYEANGRKEIILIGGDCMTGHDQETGKELWRFGGWNPNQEQSWRVVPTPVIIDGNIIFSTPQGRGKLMAVKLGGSGEITRTHKVWENTAIRTDVCAPLLYQNNLYILDGDRKSIALVNLADGKPKWSTQLESRPVFRASPSAVDGKLYLMNENAEVWVLSATDGRILFNTTLANEGLARSTIVPSQGRLFVRTGNTLYCFGN